MVEKSETHGSHVGLITAYLFVKIWIETVKYNPVDADQSCDAASLHNSFLLTQHKLEYYF